MLDQREFRRTLGLFATGVAVVTSRTRDGERIGFTVNSFASVSLAPPLILFSAAKSLRCLEKLIGADGWAINVLSEDQMAHSQRFARSLPGKWDGVEAGHGAAGAPLLAGALAVFECTPYARHEGGDHEIFVGEVHRFERAESGDPLLFFGGAYQRLAATR